MSVPIRFAWACVSVVLGMSTFLLAQAPRPSPLCVVSGRVTNGTTPLPGVSLSAVRDGAVVAATATDVGGAYRLRVPAGDYRLTASLAAFATVERTLTIADAAGEAEGSAPRGCASSVDLQLLLRSRVPSEAASAAATSSATPAPAAPARPFGRGGRGAQGQAGSGAQSRFSQLQVVQAETAGAADGASATIDDADPAARLLPPGFSTTADTNVVAVSGDAASLDRGQLRDRLGALGRGEFDAPGAERPNGFDGAGNGPPFGRFGGGFAQAGAPGGPGAGGRFGGGPGGPGGGFPGGGGRGAFLGRGRGQNPYQGSASYTFGGSALDASPYPIRANAQQEPDYTRQQFGATIGGPLRLPHVYDGSRTTFFFNYNGGRSNNLFDQYATVPTAAIRAGDFSGVASPVDPLTGVPFAGGRIPGDRLSPTALALLNYIPLPNLPGTAQNFRRTTTALNANDGFSLRVTHNFSNAAGQRGGGRGGRGGGFGGFGGRGGRGRGVTGTAVVLNAQVQYRHNDADSVNVFPSLGGQTTSSSVSAPIQVNVLHGRAIHNLQATVTRTTSSSRNGFAGVTNVAGAAGINGVATDPFDWGVPSLSFSTFGSLRDTAPSQRTDRRVQVGYTMTRPLTRHALRFGGDVRLDTSTGRTDPDARGSFVFTGLYAAGGGQVPRGTGLDFADFLLGMPQQATVQFGPGKVQLHGQAFSLFAQDDWRARGNLTFNLGVRYELVRPFTEGNGHMVNLDVAQGFVAAAPVLSGSTGIFTGAFPAALIDTDLNNVAPRVGVAWRVSPRTTLRAGYGISFNNGSYATIARQLVSQPPFAVTNTAIGTALDPLALTDPFADVAASTTTNNYGVEKDYQLGSIHTWNLDVSRTLGRLWQLGLGYTGTRGTSLDTLRAPNRDPDGLRIEGVQPFLWQSADGHSILHAGTVRLRRQPTRGIGGAVSYTLAKSIDDASSIGGGARVVAQDDRNLAAERGLSSFDRRHQFTGDLTFELPFGPNRRWLAQGGAWSSALRDWSLSANLTAESGTPFTARVLGNASDVARGTNGTLRASYNGAVIAVADPTLLHFFNTDAFGVPAAGTFGNAGRNTIVGPGQHFLNAAIGRDVRLSATRVMSIRLEANNVLNTVRYATIDTVVNSPTFGQVTSVQPMRSVQLNLRFRY
jgi:trimeric autotransporter adhesin